MSFRQIWFSCAVLFNTLLCAQGTLSGNFRLNTDFYDRDSSIGTSGANYDVNKTSANAWFQTNYSNQDLGFDASIRFDGHYNSILQNPPNPVSYYGIGAWWIKKKIDQLDIQAGYIYEQYGSGVALRTFEERNLGIDNAIFGVKAKYHFSPNYSARIIAGTQKNRLNYFGSFIKGVNLEGSQSFSEELSMNFGASVVNRTLTKEDRDEVDKVISDYALADYFQTPYNATIYQVYYTLNLGKFSWYVEGAYKSKDAVYYNGKYQYKAGHSLLTSLNYSTKSFGATYQQRWMESMQFQSTTKGSTDFNLNNNRRISYLAPINRQNSFRLPARFQIAPQDQSEFGQSFDFTYSPAKKIHLNFNFSTIDSTIGFKNPYYKEMYMDVEFKKLFGGKLDQHFGIQYIFYNQRKYLGGTEPTDIQAYTFFTESSFRFDRKKSMRLELQYQHAAKELGQSMFALIEFNMAPNWSISASDLFNFSPNPIYDVVPQYQTPHHFYSFFGSYTKGATRFTLAYSKQLAGVVCTGGVCRFEPAFSGFRGQITTSF